ncbi:MAG: hypothetical protein M3Q97_01750, partial [Bacteroidota bacterium]|nr:hypothetical protein [Bacteroidota bacterium]
KTQYLLEGKGDDPVEKTKAAREVLQSISLVNDTLKRSYYLKEAEKVLRMDEQVLYNELRKLLVNRYKKEKSVPDQPDIHFPEDLPPQAIIETKSSEAQEKTIIKNLLLYGSLPYDDNQTVGRYLLTHLAEVEWENPEAQAIYLEVKSKLETSDEIADFTYFINSEDKARVDFVSRLVMEAHSLAEGWERFLKRPVRKPEDNYLPDIDSAVRHFNLRKENSLIEQNLKEIKNAQKEEKSTEEIAELLELHQLLLKRRMEIMKAMGAVIV